MGSTYVVEQLSSSLFFSILTFYFDLILGSFFTFWGPNELFLGLGKGSNTVLGSTHVVEQLSFSLFLPIPTIDFVSILGSFFTFWGSNGLFFWIGVGFDNCFGIYLCS